MAYIGKNDLKTNFKAMQRFENVRRDAEFLGYVLGESERPNRTETCFFSPVLWHGVFWWVDETDQALTLEVIIFGGEMVKSWQVEAAHVRLEGGSG